MASSPVVAQSPMSPAATMHRVLGSRRRSCRAQQRRDDRDQQEDAGSVADGAWRSFNHRPGGVSRAGFVRDRPSTIWITIVRGADPPAANEPSTSSARSRVSTHRPGTFGAVIVSGPCVDRSGLERDREQRPRDPQLPAPRPDHRARARCHRARTVVFRRRSRALAADADSHSGSAQSTLPVFMTVASRSNVSPAITAPGSLATIEPAPLAGHVHDGRRPGHGSAEAALGERHGDLVRAWLGRCRHPRPDRLLRVAGRWASASSRRAHRRASTPQSVIPSDAGFWRRSTRVLTLTRGSFQCFGALRTFQSTSS